MPTKSPIYLKTGGKNGAGSKDGPKLREILSSDMISPPLRDFRHTAHVGRGGTTDMFGDTSFLEKDRTWSATIKDGRKDGSADGNQTSSENGKRNVKPQPAPRSRTLDRYKKDKSKHGTSSDEAAGLSAPPMQSAFSLPQLNADATNPSEDSQGATSSSAKSSDVCDSRLSSQSVEDVNLVNPQNTATPANACEGPPKPRRILSTSGKNSKVANSGNNSVGSYAESAGTKPELATGSVDSPAEDDDWKLDLGPSLMDEIMGALGNC